MELNEIQSIIIKAIEQTKNDQFISLVHWLDGELSKYRTSCSFSASTESVLPPKINNGQRFVCSCGRSFSTEITIRETTNVESSSPPATPMLLNKNDPKYQQHIFESTIKRQKLIGFEPQTPIIPTTTSSILTDNHWATNLKTYDDSSELLTGDSNRGESDIELSSDESRCLDDIDAVLSPDKNNIQQYMYTNNLWSAIVSSTTNECLSYSINNDDDQQQQQQQQQLITLKAVNNERLSPIEATIHDSDSNKTMGTIHRRPMVIACADHDSCSSTGFTYFKCTQCHETFDSQVHGQEHAKSGLCTSDTKINILDNSDSHLSPSAPSSLDLLQENIEEAFNNRLDSKSVCPICNKVFSSVHTMIRHKTSIHDRQVRYGCNICGRFFYRKDKLTSHMVYHQDFDTFVCCYCSIGCKSRFLMRQHLKRDHIIPDETSFNEILSRCQVKKSLCAGLNMSVSYAAGKQTAPLKRSISTISIENDVKQPTNN